MRRHENERKVTLAGYQLEYELDKNRRVRYLENLQE